MLGYRRYALTLGALVCGFLGWMQHAAAGPVEQLVQVAMHPSDPNVMLLRYINGGDGMLFTHDGGKTWQLACDSMQFGPQTHAGATVIAGDETTWTGVFDGLWHDDGHACGWQRQGQYDGQWFADLTHDPSDPNVVYALTSNASPMGEHVLNGVLRRDAGGAWSDFGAKEEMLASRLYVVAHGDGLRMYVSAVKGQITPDAGGTPLPNYVTRVSDDAGATWQEFVLGVTDGTFRLQGVDPTNPDRIVATINRQADEFGDAADDSVLVSSDRGAHFVESMKVHEIGGVAFAPDGRLWIGDLGESTQPTTAPGGLWFTPSLDQPAERLPMANYAVECLGYNPANDTLFACQRFAFGSVNKDDGTFSSLVKLTEVQDFVACTGAAAACETQLCNAYCGFSHFETAPVCAAYDTPACGLGAVRAELGQSTDADMGAGGAPLQPTPVVANADAGTSTANALTSEAAGSAASAAGSDPNATPRTLGKSSGGCSVQRASTRESRAPFATGWLVALALLASRARRRAAR